MEAGANRDEVVAATRRNFSLVANQKPKVESMISQGDSIAVLLREIGTFKLNGQAYRARGVQWFTFLDGKIKKIDEIVADFLENWNFQVRKLLMLFSLAAWLAAAQTGDANRRAKLPREIRDLVDQSPAAPPELAADILLRLVEAGKISDQKIRAEVLEQAFVLAGSARFPMPLIGATAEGRYTDSDVGVRWVALDNGLDTLSLECRVIRTMLDIDRRRALELF
jgi:hypothetical protein